MEVQAHIVFPNMKHQMRHAVAQPSRNLFLSLDLKGATLSAVHL